MVEPPSVYSIGIRAGQSDAPTRVRPRFLVPGRVRTQKAVLIPDPDRVRSPAWQSSVGSVYS
jgi:hypothetical protein